MANEGAKEPLLSKSFDRPLRDNKQKAPKGRRFQRCKSAPVSNNVPPDLNGIGSQPHSDSIFGRPHPSFTQVAIFLAIYLGIGTFFFYLVRHQIEGKKTNGVLDAVYFCIVTMTTVGYGDLVPDSVFAKLLACAFVFSGMALIGITLGKAADFLVEKQEVLLVKALHMRQELGPSDILKEIETNKVKYKCVMLLVLLLVLIFVGTVFLTLVEKLDLVDAFYCVCSTITTLGYGDKSFSTQAGRIFAIFWILTSTVCLAQFFLYVAELSTENRQRLLVKWVLTRKMTNVDLEAADLDQDGVVSAAEFIIYKLKEMGKISEEDIAIVMEEFEDLDVDESGTLTVSDIMIAQSYETDR